MHATAYFRREGHEHVRTIEVVRGFAAMRGFMLAHPSDRVLLFPGDNSIHMGFMRGALDVWFLRKDRGQYVVVQQRRVSPWRMARVAKADAVLEAWPGVLPSFESLRIESVEG